MTLTIEILDVRMVALGEKIGPLESQLRSLRKQMVQEMALDAQKITEVGFQESNVRRLAIDYDKLIESLNGLNGAMDAAKTARKRLLSRNG